MRPLKIRVLVSILSIILYGCVSNHTRLENKVSKKTKPVIAKKIAMDGRFIAFDNGTVKDTQTGLMWAAKDNGKDITWEEASKFCKRYKTGVFTDWRMPTLDELKTIYNPAEMNRHDFFITELIEITSCCPWPSNTEYGKAAVFSFSSGGTYWLKKTCSFNSRVLPVRKD